MCFKLQKCKKKNSFSLCSFLGMGWCFILNKKNEKIEKTSVLFVSLQKKTTKIFLVIKWKCWKKLKKKNWIRLEVCFFLSMSSNFCAHFDNKAWLIEHFWAWHIIPHFLYHACIHHTKQQVKYLMPNLFPKVKKYERSMGSSN